MQHVLPAQDHQSELRVLEGHRPPRPNVSYIDQIVGEAEDGILFSYFSGPLRRFDVDVVHIHQPHALFGGRPGSGDLPQSDLVLSALAFRLVRKLKKHGIALVQTVHGPEARTTARWRRILDRATSTFITLDKNTPTPDPRRTVCIPHAHYRDRFLGYPRAEMVQGRVLCLAPDRLERAAQGPLRVFPLVQTPGLTLRLAGEGDPGLRSDVERGSDHGQRTVTMRMERLSDAAMLQELTAAELVVLPAIETLGDENLLFLALSMDRPVMVPSSPALQDLAQEVGPRWVHLHDGPVTAELIDHTMEQLRSLPPAREPMLEDRSIDATARRYAEAFRSAAVSRAR